MGKDATFITIASKFKKIVQLYLKKVFGNFCLVRSHMCSHGLVHVRPFLQSYTEMTSVLSFFIPSTVFTDTLECVNSDLATVGSIVCTVYV